MFKRLVEIFSNFFGSIFGRKKDKPVSDNRPPSVNDKDPDLVEDSSDVPVDTVITINVMDVDIAVVDPEAGPFADDDKEDAFDESTSGPGTPEPEPGVDDNTGTPTSDTGSEPASPPEPAHTPRYLWCLDNGHGKLQAGKRSPVFDDGETQFFEYEFNRDVVERIMKALDKKGVKYFDVVPDFLEVGSFLRERVERANEKESDLPKIYVSVHANAGPAPVGEWVAASIRGLETWHAHNSKKGKQVAAIFQKHLLEELPWFKDRGLKTTQIKNLYVLVKTVMPAILTENGFYNNKEEVKKLMKDEVRQQIADAHVAAIMEIEKNGLK